MKSSGTPFSARLLVWTGIIALATCPLPAQLVNDGATNTLANVTNNITGNVTVGTNGSFTLLTLANNTLLNNTANTVIGRNASAKSNEVRIAGPNARWQMSGFGSLFVGSNGPASRLSISGGGSMQGFFFGNVGQSVTSSNNSVSVTDPGSVWAGGLFFIGGGGGNQLTVSNGATAWTSTANVGLGTSDGSNVVVITGQGSLWTNDNTLTFGSAGNRTLVSAGGRLADLNGAVGLGTSANFNTVLLTDNASSWTNSGYLFVGQGGSGNQISVSNGAALYVGGSAIVVGLESSAKSNRLSLSDVGSQLFAGPGTDLLIGSNGGFNLFSVANGATATTRIGELGRNSAGNVALLTGAGSSWSNQNALIVGAATAGNQLVISNGAKCFGGNLLSIGISDGGNANLLAVTGPGSELKVRSNLSPIITPRFLLGSNGSLNQIVVSQGASVLVDGHVSVGGSGARSNSIVVTGPGSHFQTQSNLLVVGSGYNSCVVSNGALLSSVNASFEGTNNQFIITGAGSTWSNRNTFYLYSSGDRLVVSEGARLESMNGYLGWGSSTNDALVTGPGTTLSCTSELYVGYGGIGNRLTIADNAAVSAGKNFFVGTFANSGLNELFVTGGVLRVTNAQASASLSVWPFSTNRVILNSGAIEADTILLTDPLHGSEGINFVFNGGRLATRQMTIDRPLVVGRNGNIPAVLEVVPDAAIQFNQLGPALNAPSKLTVSGLSGAITNATLTLWGLSHPMPDEVDILLAGPNNQGVMIMSDAGGLAAITNANLTFDDAAAGFLGDNSLITNGTYKPSDYEPTEQIGLPRPYALGLSAFNGTDPNGLWSLYIADDTQFNSGVLRRWSMQIQTTTGMTATISNQASLIVDMVVIGENVPGCQLLMTNSAAALETQILVVGANASSTNNRVTLNGELRISRTMELIRGTNLLAGGTLEVDWLQITNTLGIFEFTGGNLQAGRITSQNGRPFTVGDGTRPAVLRLMGNTNQFDNTLVIANHGFLTGTGKVAGLVVVQPGGTLSPGGALGALAFTAGPTLQGTVLMEIQKNGIIPTNDQIQVEANLTYGGALVVTNLGAAPLTAGDSFRLFSAANYLAGFASISLPPLAAGLGWTNKLLVDGSLAVITAPAGPPAFVGISRAGTNVVFTGTNGVAGQNYAVLTATNIMTPANAWQSVATNQFEAGGLFSFTNSINSNEPHRYFRLRTP